MNNRFLGLIFVPIGFAAIAGLNRCIHEAPNIVSNGANLIKPRIVEEITESTSQIARLASNDLPNSGKLLLDGSVLQLDNGSSDASHSVRSMTHQLPRVGIQHMDDAPWFKTATKLELVSLFPNSIDEYKNVYKKSPSLGAEKKLRSFAAEISNEPDKIKIKSGSKSDLLASLDDSDGNPIIIIAHSEDNGAIIVFPDGGRLETIELHKSCIKEQKRCLVITCFSNDFELPGAISAEDALKTWRALTILFSNYSVKNNSDLIAKARTSLYESKGKDIALSWVALTSLGVGVKVEIEKYYDSKVQSSAAISN